MSNRVHNAQFTALFGFKGIGPFPSAFSFRSNSPWETNTCTQTEPKLVHKSPPSLLSIGTRSRLRATSTITWLQVRSSEGEDPDRDMEAALRLEGLDPPGKQVSQAYRPYFCRQGRKLDRMSPRLCNFQL